MSTRTGFPRMDWDTGFLADPKFLHLRDLLPDPIRFGYAGFCFLRLTADSWRTCQRHPIGDVVRGIESWAADALRDAGLLDDAFRLPQESYEKWVGSSLEAREVWRDNQKRHRMSRGVTVTPNDSSGVAGSHEGARKVRKEDIGKEGTDGEVQEGVEDAEAGVFAFLAQHGAAIRPDQPLGRRLLGLIERRSAAAVLTEAHDMVKIEPIMSDRQWVLGLENGLEAIPSGRKSVDAAVEEEMEARSDARYERMVARRMDYYRQSGKWPAEWGPVPEAVS